jgi:hypothetical protein
MIMWVIKGKGALRFWFAVLLAGYLMLWADTMALAAKAPESAEEFAALKGESFMVIRVGKGSQVWSKAVELKLIEVSNPVKSGPTEQFSVRFQGPKKFPLDKAIHHFEHAKTGKFSLFLELAGADAKGRNYQAFFNLLKK